MADYCRWGLILIDFVTVVSPEGVFEAVRRDDLMIFDVAFGLTLEDMNELKVAVRVGQAVDALGLSRRTNYYINDIKWLKWLANEIEIILRIAESRWPVWLDDRNRSLVSKRGRHLCSSTFRLVSRSSAAHQPLVSSSYSAHWVPLCHTLESLEFTIASHAANLDCPSCITPARRLTKIERSNYLYTWNTTKRLQWHDMIWIGKAIEKIIENWQQDHSGPN